ncbi:MAG: hypothetical protein EBS48_10765 [Actinobacteria bacterium]|nr:hypothetical protein [Actinomycetota bacterium]
MTTENETTTESNADATTLAALAERDPSTLTAREARFLRGNAAPEELSAPDSVESAPVPAESLNGPTPDETLEALDAIATEEEAALTLARQHLSMTLEEQTAARILADTKAAAESRRAHRLDLATRLVAAWTLKDGAEGADETIVRLAAMTVAALDRELEKLE